MSIRWSDGRNEEEEEFAASVWRMVLSNRFSLERGGRLNSASSLALAEVGSCGCFEGGVCCAGGTYEEGIPGREDRSILLFGSGCGMFEVDDREEFVIFAPALFFPLVTDWD